MYRSDEADLVVLVVECTDSSMRKLLYDGQLTVDQFVSDHLKRLGLVNTHLQSQLNGGVENSSVSPISVERQSVQHSTGLSSDVRKSDPSVSNFCKYHWYIFGVRVIQI